jgi:molybdopterin/thiamine biosynthesis adenylyltransferase
MTEDRFDRSIRFFGADGQSRIQETALAIAGIGGLGSFVVQHAGLLGFRAIHQVDPGELKQSSRNRYATARHLDPIPGTKKVEIGRRLIHEIDPRIDVESVVGSIISDAGIASLKEADIVVGCLDTEGARLLLLQTCAVLRKPYIDLATEILPGENPLRYGGRVCCSFFGNGCLSCLDVLDHREAGRDLAGDVERAHRRGIYGVDPTLLGDSGPSVAPMNGVIASLGMMELMAHVTGLRVPKPHLNYDGRTGKVGLRAERVNSDCYFCDGIFHGRENVDLRELVRTASTCIGG